MKNIRKRGGLVKNLLAAIGAAVVVLFVLSVALSSLMGRTVLNPSESVAVVKVEGVITDPERVVRQLEEAGKRADIKAVVVRINSPGGSVGPSQEIYDEIKRLKEKKPVVASMGAVAASGGYYAAVAADRIVANPGTMTGSIGVIMEFINAEELLARLGLKGYVIKSGRYKDTGSPFRAMNAEERKLLQGVIDDVKTQFIEAVAEGRNLKVKDVARIADGRVFTGLQAKKSGLIDTLGGLTEAVRVGAELAGIKGEPNVIYTEVEGLSLWSLIFGQSGADELSGLFTGLKLMYLARPLGN